MRTISNTELDVFELCLGGNVFGWTADERDSFAVLDAYRAGGGNFLDTADSYSAWIDGHSGGESETIIGEWMAKRKNRDEMVVATKVGQLPSARGLSAKNIEFAVEGSLRRLQTDHIDLYYAHIDDSDVSLEETLGAFDRIVQAGKVRYIGASNYNAQRLTEALEISDKNSYSRYVALQPHYNLMERGYEDELMQVCQEHDLACIPYFSLAQGFLTGKYRSKDQEVDSKRGGGGRKYLDARGERVLRALDEIADVHSTTVAAVALAWLVSQPTVVSAIASARTPDQLNDLLPMAQLELRDDELDELGNASAP